MFSPKILTAAIAAATFSLAFAQGTPPQPAADPAVGAGQRSTQNTPMGTTGTPGGSGAMMQGGTSASGAAGATAGGTGATAAGTGGASGPMNSGATAGATSSGGTTAAAADPHAGHKMTTKSTKKKARKVAKADRG
jgi:hypothetical protein